MRKHAVLLSCAAGALIAALCLSGADRQGHIMFIDALKALGAKATPSEFERHYLALDARDPALSLNLAILYPWLATGAAWERIYAPTAARTAATGGTAPPRSGAPVDRLSVTDFKVGNTSFLFKAEWPFTQNFPTDKVDVLFNLGLEPEYWAPIRWDVPVTPAQLQADIEVPFDAFHLHVDGVPPPVGFFRLRPSDIWEEEDHGHFRESWDWEEDDGNPLEFIAPLDAQPPHLSIVLLASGTASGARSETLPVIPGATYLISVIYHDYALSDYLQGRPNNGTVFSWNITVPGSPAISGTVDTPALVATYANHPSYHFQDFWIVTIPTNATSSTMQMDASITQVAPAIGAAGGIAGLTASTLVLSTHSMPMAAFQTPPGSTDHGPAKRAYLKDGDTAFIAGTPYMPLLHASWPASYTLHSNHSPMQFAWRLVIETERPDYRNNATTKLDDRAYPTNSLYTAFSTRAGLDIHQMMDNEMIGGKYTLYCRARNDNGKEHEMQFKFTVRGMNPTDALAKSYIDDVVATNFTSYAWAIIRHESKDGNYVYNQFNVQNNKFKWLPNKTADTKSGRKQWGWGMAQIDRGPFTNGATRSVSTAEVWNWRTNVLSAAEILDEKLAVHNRFMGYFTNTFSNVPFPPPPHTFNGVTWPAEQFGVTVLYNGAGTNAVPQSEVWKGKINPSNGKPLLEPVRSPVVFNRNGVRKWTFHDNDHGYAARIAAELRDATSKQE